MRRTRSPIMLAVLLSLALVAGAIAGCAQKLPSTPPGITGTVTNLQPGDGRPASVLVEGVQQPSGAVSDKAQVTIAPGTMFFDGSGQPTEGAGLSVGTKVRVWFEGPVAESYPVQGTALAVQILGE
jgi:beta-N-acetylhexosaminidase